MDTAALFWSYLGILTVARKQALEEVYGDLTEAKKYLGEELLQGLGCKEETVRATLMRIEEMDLDAYQHALEERGIAFVTVNDASYPAKLRAISDQPPFLYTKGDLTVLDQPCVALVGTRQMSQYGRRVTEDFAQAFSLAGMVTVSGLASGIDTVAAEATLRAGGRTVAVLGQGLGTIYPKSNEKLAEKIVESGGLLLSEYPLDWPTSKFTFPQRNRLIAGLSLATVVLEAPEESGALITAEFALEEGREVFAVPGQIFDPNYAGCHKLIAKSQAKLVTSAADVLRDIGVIAPLETRSSFEPQTEEEGAVFKILTAMPLSVDTLVERSGMDTGRISATLTMMELSGGAKNVGGGMWVRA